MNADRSPGLIHVVAAAVTDGEGRVLIAQRPAGKHLAGGWEFPGGKVEPGETRVQALARELREELGILMREPRPLMRLRHPYDYGDVLLDMWVVSRYRGEPRGMDGQAIRWCWRAELDAANLLPADRPIVRALRLPERLTDESSCHYQVAEIGACGRLAELGGTDGETRGVHAALRDGFHPMLKGLLCSNLQEGLAIARSGIADFLVMRDGVSEEDLTVLCQSVLLPVYACIADLEHAWSLGVSGLNEIRSQG